MKRWRISWTEKHSADVDAESQEEACQIAWEKNHHDTLDTTDTDSVEVLEPEYEREDDL